MGVIAVTAPVSTLKNWAGVRRPSAAARPPNTKRSSRRADGVHDLYGRGHQPPKTSHGTLLGRARSRTGLLLKFSETCHERTDKEDCHNREQKPARDQDPLRWRPPKNHGSCQDDEAEHAYQHSE